MIQDLLQQIINIWPRLEKVSTSEKQWLIDAIERVVDAGASSIENRFVPRNWDGSPKDSPEDRTQLLDLLAELRIGADLASRGFSLGYEVPGIGDKSVDFKASINGINLWAEVKQLNLDQDSRNFIELTHKAKCPFAITSSWLKDDVRIGRLIKEAAKKMPENNDMKCVVIFVSSLEDYVIDAKDYLFNTRDESDRWASIELLSIGGVVVAAPAPGWSHVGPINMVLLANPKRESEARIIVEQWPMRLIGKQSVSLGGHNSGTRP